MTIPKPQSSTSTQPAASHKELQELIHEGIQKAFQDTQRLSEGPGHGRHGLSDDEAVAKVHAIVQFINNTPTLGRTLKAGVPLLNQAMKYDNRNIANKVATFLVFNTDVIEKAINGSEADVLALRDWFLNH